MNKFQAMMETIDVPAGATQRVLDAAAAQSAPRRSYKNLAIAALAVVLAVATAVGAGAYSRNIKRSRAINDPEPLSLEQGNDMLAKVLGTTPADACFPKQFSNGFVYSYSIRNHFTNEYDDSSSETYDEVSAIYARDGGRMYYSISPAQLGQVSDRFLRRDIGGVTVWYFENTFYGYQTPDGTLSSDSTDSDVLREYFGEDIPEPVRVDPDCCAFWIVDGVYHQMCSSDGSVTMDELLDMAAEIIDN